MNLAKKLTISLSAMILGGLLAGNNGSVQAQPSHAQNVYYDYNTTATICGTWGANLFNGNDENKTFNRILPKNSQWQVYGYTWRGDGYYYYAGGNLWIQANQAKVPTYTDADAILNVVTRVSGENAKYGWKYTAGWWGAGHYITQHCVYQIPDYIADESDESLDYLPASPLYIVQQNGDTENIGQ